MKPPEEFMANIKERLIALKAHHFTVEKQSQYLRNLKKYISDNTECKTLVDFSENFTFLI